MCVGSELRAISRTLHCVTVGGSDGEGLTDCSPLLSGVMACMRLCMCACVRVCAVVRGQGAHCAPCTAHRSTHTPAMILPSLIRGPHSISAIPVVEGRSTLICVRECSGRARWRDRRDLPSSTTIFQTTSTVW